MVDVCSRNVLKVTAIYVLFSTVPTLLPKKEVHICIIWYFRYSRRPNCLSPKLPRYIYLCILLPRLQRIFFSSLSLPSLIRPFLVLSDIYIIMQFRFLRRANISAGALQIGSQVCKLRISAVRVRQRVCDLGKKSKEKKKAP